LVRDTKLSPANLILPLFVRAGKGVRQAIGSMPGHFQLSPDLLGDEVREAAARGVGGVILFGIPAEKDATGSEEDFRGVTVLLLAKQGYAQPVVRIGN
jgi:porphobilinogen synthase